MLKYLSIRNFTIIHAAELELSSGLTVLTGETGAGKSILIDALQLVLGERAESGLIKRGEQRCEVAAIFDIAHNPRAQEWLKTQEMDEGTDCLVRRVISQDGRSRTTINARPSSLQSLRDLGALLIHIHGQTQHHRLLSNDFQRQLVDEYAGNSDECQRVYTTYKQWREASATLAAIAAHEHSNQRAFLEFQLQELDELGLGVNELVELAEEHRRLSHAEQWINTALQALQVLSDQEHGSVLQGLYAADNLLHHLPNQCQTARELVRQAVIQTDEATAQVRQALKTLESNPERMQWVEQRLMRIHDVARKYRVTPEELLVLQQDLTTQYQRLDQSAERIALLEQQIAELTAAYALCAQQLTQCRQGAVKKLSRAVTKQIQTLGMPGGRIEVQLLPRESALLHPQGAERIEFLVSTNPGQALQGLSKVVSGGELSRIALAVQVVVAQAAILPTLIFDEVDVGIGGGTAEVVGRQLKALGERTQVLCVTHLPQVAAQGNHHLRVQKSTQLKQTVTQLRLLVAEEKIHEIARMLGGVNITDKTLAHAREMLG